MSPRRGGAGGDEGRHLTLSPAVRRLVLEHHLDPSKIKGTGKDGRLTKDDVLAAAPKEARRRRPPRRLRRLLPAPPPARRARARRRASPASAARSGCG
jgi:2-oxoglutarate dehydrogenase E2 component (dihydrolipoamide succinyltransferase)